MANRGEFVKNLAALNLSHLERAVALLWYYRETQEFEERTPLELAEDLHDEGFPKPNITRLKQDLLRSKFSIRGRRQGSFQVDVRRLAELRKKYGDFLKIKRVDVSESIIPNALVSGTRKYLEALVHEINGCYDYGFYDACVVLCRRLMESLIIEIYISAKRHHEIQNDGVFIPLEKLINYIKSDRNFVLGRSTPKTMTMIKKLGDTAAHDRVYITLPEDINDIKASYRKMITELLHTSNIRK